MRWEYNETAHNLSIDLKKADDSVRRGIVQYSYTVWGTHEATQAD
jgi:hypothetical protein